jgi:tripartite-type tricarboxylate transporter receptor subunit TctC
MLAQQSLGRIAGLAILLAPLLAPPARAEDFYKGKTISLIESGLTGAYDGYARALARCMPRYIPGNPAIVVQGKPGAAGVVAANYLYNIAPRDGTVIATVHGNVLVAPLLSTGQVKFDLAKFGWIGNVTHDTYVGYVMSTAPIKTLADARTTEVSMAGTSVGAGGIDMAILGRDLFGFKFKIVSGYKTSGETELALERGEVEGTFGHAWGSLKNQKPDWLRDGKVRIVVQHGFTRNAESDSRHRARAPGHFQALSCAPRRPACQPRDPAQRLPGLPCGPGLHRRGQAAPSRDGSSDGRRGAGGPGDTNLADARRRRKEAPGFALRLSRVGRPHGTGGFMPCALTG